MPRNSRRLIPWIVGALLCAVSPEDGHAYVVVDPFRPTLADVFAGTARFQTIGESEEVTLNMDLDGKGRQLLWDQKLAILPDDETGQYHAFTRGYVEGTKKFMIAVLTSRDGLTFDQTGVLFPELYADPTEKWTLYDPHVSFDGEKYLLATECANRTYGPSLCLSETRTPFDLSSWSRPAPIVRNSPVENQSASTGVSLNYDGETYITWTVVDDGRTPYAEVRDGDKVVNDEDGDESTFSKAMKLQKNLDGDFIYSGQSVKIGKTIAGADRNPYCTSSWDCNNIDIQDWKVEDGKVYAIYNGANYYRCFRPDGEMGKSNRWGIGIRRSDRPLGDYSESSGILIQSAVDDVCGISYPVLNTIGGETYLYYSYYSYGPGGNRINRTMRSRLIRDVPLAVTDQTATRTSGSRVSRALADPGQDAMADGIQRLYVKFLDRYPRNDEVDGHLALARKDGFGAVVRAVVLSKEHRRVWASRNTAQRIASLYQGILDRVPDRAGSGRVEDMIVEQAMPLDTLYRVLLDSPEFRSGQLSGR